MGAALFLSRRGELPRASAEGFPRGLIKGKAKGDGELNLSSREEEMLATGLQLGFAPDRKGPRPDAPGREEAFFYLQAQGHPRLFCLPG